jgi:drug/metabolite transporter (DMT)-like permease
VFKSPSSHLTSVLQALFVTFLWSTSWVLIKIGLADIPALTFAGLRYSLAFLLLLPFALRSNQLGSLGALSTLSWIRLLFLGLMYYAITQGAQFLGLVHLPAVTVSLLLNFSPIVVAMLGLVFLAERPGTRQWAGAGLSIGGTIIYFFPIALQEGEALGLFFAFSGLLANSASAVLGRYINRSGELTPLTVTVISMGLGALVLLVAGIISQGLPALTLVNWTIITWLAVVNTAFAFTLWNHTLRTLSAVESSIINNTMLVQIAILAWLFLGENLTTQQVSGLAIATAGVLIVQLRKASRPNLRPA